MALGVPAPFMSHVEVWPVEGLCQKMSDLPSPLKSARVTVVRDCETLVTVIVAELLFTVPHEFDTRTQYDVVDAGVTAIELAVPPATGLEVFPLAPKYH